MLLQNMKYFSITRFVRFFRYKMWTDNSVVTRLGLLKSLYFCCKKKKTHSKLSIQHRILLLLNTHSGLLLRPICTGVLSAPLWISLPWGKLLAEGGVGRQSRPCLLIVAPSRALIKTSLLTYGGCQLTMWRIRLLLIVEPLVRRLLTYLIYVIRR